MREDLESSLSVRSSKISNRSLSGGSGMVDLLEQLFSVIWQKEIVPRQWRDDLIVNILRKGIERILVIIGVSPYSVL